MTSLGQIKNEETVIDDDHIEDENNDHPLYDPPLYMAHKVPRTELVI